MQMFNALFLVFISFAFRFFITDLSHKGFNLPELFFCRFFIQHTQVTENLFLQFHQCSGQQFFIFDCISLGPVGDDIIDIFDENNIGFQFIQVIDQGTVSSGTEYQLPFAVSQ